MIIKTREDWERIKLWLLRDRDVSDPPAEDTHIIETIEALEKVTRAVQTLDLEKAGYSGGTSRSIYEAEMKLAMAMTEIPDWLTGANHQ